MYAGVLKIWWNTAKQKNLRHNRTHYLLFDDRVRKLREGGQERSTFDQNILIRL